MGTTSSTSPPPRARSDKRARNRGRTTRRTFTPVGRVMVHCLNAEVSFSLNTSTDRTGKRDVSRHRSGPPR